MRLANKVEQILGVQKVSLYRHRTMQGEDTSPKVLIIDDSEKVHIKFRSLLPKEFNVFTASNADEAEALCKSEEIGWIIIDMVIPNAIRSSCKRS